MLAPDMLFSVCCPVLPPNESFLAEFGMVVYYTRSRLKIWLTLTIKYTYHIIDFVYTSTVSQTYNYVNIVSIHRCPVLMITGQKSVFNKTTKGLHEALIRTCEDKAKVEFIEMAGVANILEAKVCEHYIPVTILMIMTTISRPLCAYSVRREFCCHI